VLGDDSEPPAETRGWRRPVLGYTGTIHAERLDVELLEYVATKWNGSVVLIGPDYLPSELRCRLAAAGVILLGPIAYSQLPQFMRGFDACIVPHRVTAFTESLNPIKLWEYLASGKPIVSTRVAGFRDFPELVSLADNADQFRDAAAVAVREPTDSPVAAARIREASQHSWKVRVDAIEDIMRSCLGCNNNLPTESAK
jgi:glycosyltransferase involved in cell wall biosynthesis